MVRQVFVKILGILMVVMGLAAIVGFKKREGSFKWKSKNGASVLFFLVCGFFLFATATPNVKVNDYSSIVPPTNAPWEVEMTKEEAKERNRSAKKNNKNYQKYLNLSKSDKEVFINSDNELAMIRAIISELTNIGVAMADESGNSYDLSKKDAKIMLKYVQSVEKQLESSADYLLDNYDNAQFAYYAADITESRNGLEKALKAAVKGRSYDEIDEIIADEYYHYAMDAYTYYFNGEAYTELLGAFTE